ncbi:hypothetical protein SAMN05444377_101206 [Flavobacterium fontis]|uniref:DUF6705 domain-containing protein n=1 Tax=Flavobacterium fontis TaxID=1124188 RepID=A0A1M4W7V3_9FLAO|nr:DUF6705 family protein [Flavobacterium fontis]SHE77341.1 hypothetical protein SAMN05444377_101206 [Flavobacterium fontis]
MKKIVQLFVGLWVSVNAFSQTQTVDLALQGDLLSVEKTPIGYYFKDMYHVLDPYVGTWVFTDGTTQLKLVLQKKMSNRNNVFFQDMIYGEYQYIENGIEKVNTLSQLNENFSDCGFYSINGNLVVLHDSPLCFGCEVGEKTLATGIIHDESESIGRLLLKRIIVNGQPALQASMGWRLRWKPAGTVLPPNPLPARDFILLLQP